MSFIKYLKSISIITILGGVSYIGYEIRETYKILNHAIDTSVIDAIEPKLKKLSDKQGTKKYEFIDPPGKAPSFIDRFWFWLTFDYARRLLNIAQSDNRNFRLRAVNDLARIKNLDNWHYTLLAHMCDARTAVGLARTKDVNLNYFLSPPNKYIYYNHDKIVYWMKNFLTSLAQCSNHPCTQYFIDKIFINLQEVGRMVEHDITSIELKQCIQSADEIFPLCIQSILHHSTVEDFAKDIVKKGGLPLLMELYNRYKCDPEIIISMVRIMASISMFPELLQDIYQSGWIGVLAELINHNDIRISGPAAKALANLDSDDCSEEQFLGKIYLLYPEFRSSYPRDMDVILVHGLLGGVFFTWRQRDRNQITTGFLGKKPTNETISSTSSNTSCIITSDPSTNEYLEEMQERQKAEWSDIGKDFEVVYHDCPKDLNDGGPYTCPGEEICEMDDGRYSQCWPRDWLPRDYPNLRIIGINYDTNLSFWSPMCPIDNMDRTLDQRSKDFLERLANAGVGDKPIAWLAHSMGGLLVKNILVKAKNSKDEKLQRLCDNSKGIIFYSTPHRGSHVASLNQTTSLFIWPSTEVRQLREGCPSLLELHKEFTSLLESTKIKIISFVETEYTTITPLKIQVNFVPLHSANMDQGEFYEMPLDHLRICKPLNRHSFMYRKVVMLIDDILQDTKN